MTGTRLLIRARSVQLFGTTRTSDSTIILKRIVRRSQSGILRKTLKQSLPSPTTVVDFGGGTLLILRLPGKNHWELANAQPSTPLRRRDPSRPGPARLAKQRTAGHSRWHLKVCVTPAPEKGKANRAIIEVLAKTVGLRKSQIELLSGETASQKEFLVRDIELDELAKKVSPGCARATPGFGVEPRCGWQSSTQARMRNAIVGVPPLGGISG